MIHPIFKASNTAKGGSEGFGRRGRNTPFKKQPIDISPLWQTSKVGVSWAGWGVSFTSLGQLCPAAAALCCVWNITGLAQPGFVQEEAFVSGEGFRLFNACLCLKKAATWPSKLRLLLLSWGSATDLFCCFFPVCGWCGFCHVMRTNFYIR